MAQEQIQRQELTQQQKLSQTVTQQQLLLAQLTEMPLMQLTERVNMEMNDNPALEQRSDDMPEYGDAPEEQFPQDTVADGDSDYEREERRQAMDDALEQLGRDDEDLPVYYNGKGNDEGREESVYGQTESFIDLLHEQMNIMEMTSHERDIMEYLIGSLDDDGLLRKSIDTIADELAVYNNIDATQDEVERVLRMLQQFDPAGIGARSLQECLLLQVARREPSKLRDLMERTLKHHFEPFTKKHWDRLQRELKLNDLQAEALIGELRKLNPKPGASLSETVGRSLHQITPDFYIDTHDDGTVTMTLNSGEVPELRVSQSFTDTLNELQSDSEQMSSQKKEALLYARKKVIAAQRFIDALNARRHTLMVTMRAIIAWQHKFFEDGDEASLRPMILKDISEKTGLDLSTISRVANSKYAQTRWGVFPLKYFFGFELVTAEGETLSTREVKATLRDLIDGEDKSSPLSDDALQRLLQQKGYPIARRTVSKYREQMDIPVARLRRG